MHDEAFVRFLPNLLHGSMDLYFQVSSLGLVLPIKVFHFLVPTWFNYFATVVPHRVD